VGEKLSNSHPWESEGYRHKVKEMRRGWRSGPMAERLLCELEGLNPSPNPRRRGRRTGRPLPLFIPFVVLYNN
jgi:hypothetical protein